MPSTSSIKLCKQHEEKITLGKRSSRIMHKNLSQRKDFPIGPIAVLYSKDHHLEYLKKSTGL